MKRNKELWFLLMIGVLLFPRISFGQCDTDEFLDKCASNLGTFNYVKSFNINASSRKKAISEYSYIFSKGSKYLLIVCNENVVGMKMSINLYDRDHNLVATSYDEKNKNQYNSLQYNCSSTGVYYIKVAFEGAKRCRGMCILGFSKN